MIGPATGDRPTVLLLVLGTALLPLQIWPPMPLPGMQLSDAVFVLAFLRFVWSGGAVPPPAAAVAIAAFAAGAAMSRFAGGSEVKLIGHFELAALGWMSACLSPGNAVLVRRALVAAAALAALTAILGLAFYVTGNAGYDEAGYPDHPLLYLHGSLVSDSYPRPRGTLATGAMVTAVVATGVLLLWFERSLVPAKGLRCAIYLACAVAMFFAFSRPIATLAVVLAGAELLRRGGPSWLRVAFAAVVLVYAAALWISLRYNVRLNPLEPWAVEVLAEDGDRFGRWRVAAQVIAENPLLGLGPGVPVAGGWEAHNTWLNIWAGIGVVPLAAFAGLLAASLRATVTARSIALGAALAFALVESLYNDIEDMRHVWLLVGLAAGAGQARGGAARPVDDHEAMS